LAAGHVHRGGDADVGDLLGAVLLNDSLELLQVDVAFERMEAVRVVGLVDDDVNEGSSGELLVQARGSEVHVAGNDVAGLDENFGDEVLGAASLVRGHDVLVPVILLDNALEAVEALAAGVGFVANHHGGPLAVAHG